MYIASDISSIVSSILSISKYGVNLENLTSGASKKIHSFGISPKSCLSKLSMICLVSVYFGNAFCSEKSIKSFTS